MGKHLAASVGVRLIIGKQALLIKKKKSIKD